MEGAEINVQLPDGRIMTFVVPQSAKPGDKFTVHGDSEGIAINSATHQAVRVSLSRPLRDDEQTAANPPGLDWIEPAVLAPGSDATRAASGYP